MYYSSFLDTIPRWRSDYVTDLDLPDYYTLSPYYYRSWADLDCCVPRKYSSSSSLALSRALTDSDIDYDWYNRYKSRLYSNTWDALATASARFPSLYLDSLRRYYWPKVTKEVRALERRNWYRNEELLSRMRRYLDEECQVYKYGDPGLLDLEEALRNLDHKVLYSSIKY